MNFMPITFVLASLLIQKKDDPNGEKIVTTREIVKWSNVMEQKTSLAVLNGFCESDVAELLGASRLRACLKPIMGCNDAWKLDEHALFMLTRHTGAKTYPQRVMDFLDPPLNVPMDLIIQAGLLAGLESEDSSETEYLQGH